MVKQKHHTGRNQSLKNHKNGIKKMKNYRYKSTQGVSKFELRRLNTPN
jgi:large subunit ribosomal protein L29e